MKKIVIVLTVLLTTIVGLNVYTNNNVKAEDTNHTLTIKKETKDNKQGEFTYRVKVWKAEDIHLVMNVGSMNADPFPVFYYENMTINGFTQMDAMGNFARDWGYWNEAYLSSDFVNSILSNKEEKYFIDELNVECNFLNTTVVIDGIEYRNVIRIDSGSGDSFTEEYGGIYVVVPSETKFDHTLNSAWASTFYGGSLQPDKYTNTTYLDLSSQLGQPVEENTYEFKLNQGSSKTISIPEGYKYEVIEVDKENWELESINNNPSLTKAEGTMTKDETYTFKNKKLTYDILINHYKENSTEKLGEEQIKDKPRGFEYTTSPLSNIPEGYVLVGTPSNASGTVDGLDIIVNYYYKLKDVELTIKHVTEDGTEVIPSSKETKKYGDSYTTSPMDNDEYELVSTPNNASGTIKENTTVTYTYKKKVPVPQTGTITVKYVDEEGNEISSSEVSTKEVGTSYTSKPKEIEGYVIKEKPSTESYTYTKEGQTVTYTYERIRLKVSTKVRNNIGGNIEGDEEVLYGENSTAGKIHIKANQGYVINKVYINGSEIEVPKDSTELNISNFIKMSEEKLVEVEFKEKVTNKQETKVKVPPTSANTIYTMLGMLGLIAIGIFGIYYNKKIS